MSPDSAGHYQGTVTVTPMLPPNVTGLHGPGVHNRSDAYGECRAAADFPVCWRSCRRAGEPSNTASIPIASNGDAAPFTVTTSGEKWLAVNPTTAPRPPPWS